MADLRPVVAAWIGKIHKAWDSKKKEFQNDADEAMQFFNGPYSFLYEGRAAKEFAGDDDGVPAPSFRMTMNKVAEMVQLFGPALYSRNPVRKVGPRKLPELPPDVIQLILSLHQDPQGQMELQQGAQQEQQEQTADVARAVLLEHYLNYTPLALDLKTESRWAIDEAIIKGAGLLWCETYTPPGAGMKMVGSFYDTIDNLVIDPDAENIREAKWVARRRCRPYWEVERERGMEPGTLKGKGSVEGQNQQGVVAGTGYEYRRREGQTNDLLVYWQVYSKMGLGGRLAGVAPELAQGLESYGDFVYVEVAESCDWPLNIPRELSPLIMDQDPNVAAQAQAQTKEAFDWPTPYWADDSWPFTMFSFHDVPKRVWPMSHLKPGLGELKFLNWAYSMLLAKIRVCTRDFIAIVKSANQEVKEAIKHGGDYTVIEVEELHQSIDKMVSFLQHPGFNPEIYTVIQGVTENFERRTGLSELLYGISSRQMRSAEEAQVKGDYASIRPDDMTQKVEDSMSDVARKEALAARWHLVGGDVAPLFGPLGSRWWDLFVTPSDPARVLHQLEYRIEAGTAKKPNKALERDNMQTALQTVMPNLWQYANLTGNVRPYNALIRQWAKSIDLDPTEFELPEGSVPPPAPPAPPGGDPNAAPAPDPNAPPPQPAPPPPGVPQ